jgi:hypothetical protein
MIQMLWAHQGIRVAAYSLITCSQAHSPWAQAKLISAVDAQLAVVVAPPAPEAAAARAGACVIA